MPLANLSCKVQAFSQIRQPCIFTLRVHRPQKNWLKRIRFSLSTDCTEQIFYRMYLWVIISCIERAIPLPKKLNMGKAIFKSSQWFCVSIMRCVQIGNHLTLCPYAGARGVWPEGTHEEIQQSVLWMWHLLQLQTRVGVMPTTVRPRLVQTGRIGY